MVDPDSLLIFKLRENGVSAQQPEKQKEEPAKQNAPALAKPEAAKPKAQQQEKQKEEPAKQNVAAPAKPDAAKPKAQQPSATAPKRSSVLGSSNNRDREPELKISEDTYTISQYQPYNVRPEETTSVAQSEAFPDPGVYFTSDVQQSKYKSGYGKLVGVRNKAQSKDVASKMTCVQHPWRHAYAVCFACHRPFCFEDIVEYKKGYYCSNDMSKISDQYKARLASEYALANLIPALLIMSLTLAMLYYSSGALSSIATYIGQNGVHAFINSATIGSDFIIADVAILLINMFSAIYAITQSRKSAIANIAITVVAVVLMSYQFFTYQFSAQFESLIAIIALVEFAAFAVSVHAVATRVLIEDKSSYFNDIYDFTYAGTSINAGRF